MAKVTYTLDDVEDDYDMKLITNRREMAYMLDEIRNYIRNLNKYEERNEIPTEEISNKLSNIIDKWYYIDN